MYICYPEFDPRYNRWERIVLFMLSLTSLWKMKLLKFRSTSKRLFCAVSLFSFSWIHKWIAYHFVIKEVKNSNGDWSSVHVPSFGHTQPLAFTWKTTQSENSHKRGLQPISSRTTNLCLAKSHICIVRGGGGGGWGTCMGSSWLKRIRLCGHT